MKAIKKSTLCVVLAVFALVLISNVPVLAGEKKTVKYGHMSWKSFQIQANITKHILEEYFDYEVELVEFVEWGVAFAAASRGNVDFFDTGINFYAYDYWVRFKEKLEKVGANDFGLQMGVVVPSYVPINSLAELNQHKDKFKKRIIGIEKGSGLNRMIKEVIDAYDLDYRLIEGSTPGMQAEMTSALNRKEWIVTGLWDPSWMTLRWDVKFLSDPMGIQQPPQGDQWIGRKGFSKDYPFLREVLSGIFFKKNDRLIWEGWLKDGKTPEQVAADWLELPSAKTLVKRWVTIGSPDRYE